MRDLDCRWITCDTYCHYTECLLKKAYVDQLSDKFEELGLKCPHVAFQISDACDHDDKCQFINDRDPETGRKISRSWTEDDAEAKKYAEAKIAQLGKLGLHALYRDCMYKKISIDLACLKKDIEQLQLELSEITTL